MCDFLENEEFQNFMKATSFIQEFTRRLLERSTRNINKIPDNLSNVNQLSCIVKQFLREQQELAAKVEKVHDMQKNLNDLVKEKLEKCHCNVQLEVRNLLTKDIKLDDVKQGDGMDFTLKIPTTSSIDYTASLNRTMDADAQQLIDLQLLKMFGGANLPPLTVSHNDFYHNQHHPHQVPHTSCTQENGSIMQDLKQETPYFDPTFSPEKLMKISASNTKSAKKRPNDNSATGPYKCRDCDKTFRQKHGLNQHLLTHETNGAFECDGCGKRYSRQESVYRHRRSNSQCSKYLSLALLNGSRTGQSSPWDPPTNETLMKQRIFFEHPMLKIPESGQCSTR